MQIFPSRELIFRSHFPFKSKAPEAVKYKDLKFSSR